MEEVKKIKFRFLCVNSTFTTNSTFSTTNLGRLQKTDFRIEADKLFCWDKVSENFPQIIDAMEKTKDAQLLDGPTEHLSFYSIAKTVLASLGSKSRFLLVT